MLVRSRVNHFCLWFIYQLPNNDNIHKCYASVFFLILYFHISWYLLLLRKHTETPRVAIKHEQLSICNPRRKRFDKYSAIESMVRRCLLDSRFLCIDRAYGYQYIFLADFNESLSLLLISFVSDRFTRLIHKLYNNSN